MKCFLLCLLLTLLAGAMGQTYFGTNQAALGWGSSALPGKVWTNYPLISNASLDYFAAKGMNTIRISIIWERLQPVLNNGEGDFNMTYVGFLSDSINYVTNIKGMYCLLDLHNYNRYRGNILGSAEVPYTALTNVWRKLASLYKDNARMLWGSMNEPHDVSYESVRISANAAIKGIRDSGATQLITIAGNNYTAVYSWVGGNSLWMGPENITDPLNNFIYEVHQYFDGQGGQTVCKPNWPVQYWFDPITNWARENKVKLFLGEFGINDSDECLAVLEVLMTYIRNNTDVWDGWTWWAAGPWWEPDYVYLLEPFANGTDRNRLMPTLQKYFPEKQANVPSASPSVVPVAFYTALLAVFFCLALLF